MVGGIDVSFGIFVFGVFDFLPIAYGAPVHET